LPASLSLSRLDTVVPFAMAVPTAATVLFAFGLVAGWLSGGASALPPRKLLIVETGDTGSFPCAVDVVVDWFAGLRVLDNR